MILLRKVKLFMLDINTFAIWRIIPINNFTDYIDIGKRHTEKWRSAESPSTPSTRLAAIASLYLFQSVLIEVPTPFQCHHKLRTINHLMSQLLRCLNYTHPRTVRPAKCAAGRRGGLLGKILLKYLAVLVGYD